jgi:RhoGEF domain
VETPELGVKELKRVKTRYKIISEIVQTERTFVEDMKVLSECYFGCCHECQILTAKHKQVIFGRVKNVSGFAQRFMDELVVSAAGYLKLQEEEINQASLYELIQWDAATSVGEVFWSSVDLTRRQLT